MNLKDIFGVFSRRHPSPRSRSRKPLTPTFRTRVVMLYRDRLISPDHGDYSREILAEVQRRLTYLLGRRPLAVQGVDALQDLGVFLQACADEHFLDSIEYVFQVDQYFQAVQDENQLGDDINQALAVDDLPYAVTRFVREPTKEMMFGRLIDTYALVARPRVIARDDDVVFKESIAPALELLADRRFKAANLEFLDALEDFRKARYGDSLTKCCSAFESTMKLVCEARGWSYQPNDTAAKLIPTIVKNSGLEMYFEQPLMIIATLRNRLSTAHGGGSQSRTVAPHVVKYAINATAAAILLLVDECA